MMKELKHISCVCYFVRFNTREWGSKLLPPSNLPECGTVVRELISTTREINVCSATTTTEFQIDCTSYNFKLTDHLSDCLLVFCDNLPVMRPKSRWALLNRTMERLIYWTSLNHPFKINQRCLSKQHEEADCLTSSHWLLVCCPRTFSSSRWPLPL